jgi:hypothetical protein
MRIYLIFQSTLKIMWKVLLTIPFKKRLILIHVYVDPSMRKLTSHVSDVAAIVHPQNINVNLM